MTKIRIRRSFLVTCVAGLLTPGGSGLWLRIQRQTVDLDCRLMVALRQDNSDQAIALLNHGAHPNSTYHPMPVPSPYQQLNYILHRSSPPANDSPTAFQIASGADFSDDYSEWVHCSEAPRLVQTMLEHGAELNAPDPAGCTPLLWAVKRNYRKTVDMLLEHRANTNIGDRYAFTPLMAAAQVNPNIMPQLIDRGANVQAKSRFGDLPLVLAVGNSEASPDDIRMLLEHGADVNAKGHNGYTAIIAAVFHSRPLSTIVLLLEHGADVNVQAGGYTPLFWATQRSHSTEDIETREIIPILLAYGADPDVGRPFSPMQIAQSYQRKDLVRLFMKVRTKKSPRTTGSRSPLRTRNSKNAFCARFSGP